MAEGRVSGRRWRLLALVALGWAVLWAVFLPTAALAATITVDDPSDDDIDNAGNCAPWDAGDGDCDLGDALQCAMVSWCSGGVGSDTIVFASGITTVTLTSPLDITNASWADDDRGDILDGGGTVTVVCNTASPSRAFQIHSDEATPLDFTLKNLTITNCNDGGIVFVAWSSQPVDGVTIENVTVQNSAYGVLFPSWAPHPSTNITIIGSEFVSISANGIRVDNASSNITVLNTTFTDVGLGWDKAAIWLVAGSNITIKGSTVQDGSHPQQPDYGVYINGPVSQVTIGGSNPGDGNTLQDMARYGVYVSGGAQDITLQNNLLQNNVQAGLYVDAAAHLTVEGNTFQNNGDYGVLLTDWDGGHDRDIADITLRNNAVTAHDKAGVYITTGPNEWMEDILLESNTVQNNGGGGWPNAGVAAEADVQDGPDADTYTLVLRNNTVAANNDKGIYLASGLQNALVQGGQVQNNTAYGLLLDGNVQNVWVDGVQFTGNTQAGILLNTATNMQIQNSTFLGPGQDAGVLFGAWGGAPQNITLHNNTFRQNNYGLLFPNGAATAQVVAVDGNTFRQQATAGVYVANASMDITITASTFDGNGQYGVYVAGAARDVSLQGNGFVDHGTTGSLRAAIYLAQVADGPDADAWAVRVDGNTIWNTAPMALPANTTAYGIFIGSGAGPVQVQNNRVGDDGSSTFPGWVWDASGNDNVSVIGIRVEGAGHELRNNTARGIELRNPANTFNNLAAGILLYQTQNVQVTGSDIRNVTVSGAASPEAYALALIADASDVTNTIIDGGTFDGSEKGIVLTSWGAGRVQNTTLRNATVQNNADYGLLVSDTATLTVEDVTLQGNGDAAGEAGMLILSGQDILITGNTVFNNNRESGLAIVAGANVTDVNLVALTPGTFVRGANQTYALTLNHNNLHDGGDGNLPGGYTDNACSVYMEGPGSDRFSGYTASPYNIVQASPDPPAMGTCLPLPPVTAVCGITLTTGSLLDPTTLGDDTITLTDACPIGVRVVGDNVTVRGLRFITDASLAASPAPPEVMGILVQQGRNVRLENNVFENWNIVDTTGNAITAAAVVVRGDAGPVGVANDALDEASAVRILNNTVRNLTMRSNHPQGWSALMGFLVYEAAGHEVEDVIIEQNAVQELRQQDKGSAQAVLLTEDADQVRIRFNTLIRAGDVGIVVTNWSPSATNPAHHVTIAENEIAFHHESGINLNSGAHHIVVEANTLTENGSTGIAVADWRFTALGVDCYGDGGSWNVRTGCQMMFRGNRIERHEYAGILIDRGIDVDAYANTLVANGNGMVIIGGGGGNSLVDNRIENNRYNGLVFQPHYGADPSPYYPTDPKGNPAQGPMDDDRPQYRVVGNRIRHNGTFQNGGVGVRCEDTWVNTWPGGSTSCMELARKNDIGPNGWGKIVQYWRGAVEVLDASTYRPIKEGQLDIWASQLRPAHPSCPTYALQAEDRGLWGPKGTPGPMLAQDVTRWYLIMDKALNNLDQVIDCNPYTIVVKYKYPLPRSDAGPQARGVLARPQAVAAVAQLGLAYFSWDADPATHPVVHDLHHPWQWEGGSVEAPAGLYQVAQVFTPALVTGFPPGRITRLPRPWALHHQATGVRLRIPGLGIDAEVVAVSPDDPTAVAWLGNRVGYVQGTAFPTWQGNSVLTAHSWLPSGAPGPFRHLDWLKPGDVFSVVVNGVAHYYRVQQVVWVDPDAYWPYAPIRDGRSWLTLITCASWDARAQTFRKRIVVRAVFIGTGPSEAPP